MKSTLPDEALNQIFHEGRTHSAWLDKPVSDEILRQLYDLMKWGPTSANGSPARFVFSAHAGGKRASTARAGAGKRGEDDDCTGHGDHRLRSAVF